MNGSLEFWGYLDQLVVGSEVVIDRPKGTPHPDFPEMIYPLDYGYLQDTIAGDGDGIDVWRGELSEPALVAVALTVDLGKRDAEIKLLLGCTEAEQHVIQDFLSRHGMRAWVLPRAQQSVLHRRRSVRRFQAQPVPRDLVESVIRTAMCAPSSHNRQPWRFAVVTNQANKDHLASAMGADFRRDLLQDGLPGEEVERQVQRSIQRITSAPVVIVVCLSVAELFEYPEARRQEFEYLMGVQSVAMAGENLLLAAHLEGLGGVWICAPLFAQETVQRVLHLPGDWQPQGMILLGYPAVKPAPRSRKTLAEVVQYY